MIKFTQQSVDNKAEQEELEEMKIKYAELETECDEVRQRSMNGNIILSSPNLQDKPTLLVPKQITDPVTGCIRNECCTEMCARLIYMKTGVTVPVTDIVACHVLSKQGSDSTYIIRFGNRRPGSAFDIVAAGMLTGRNKESKANFTNANVFLNFQLTKKEVNWFVMSEQLKKIKRL